MSGASEHGNGAAGSLRQAFRSGGVLRGVSGTGGLGLAQMALSLASAVLLARLLGAEEYGVYVFALALVNLVAVPIDSGLPQFLTREIAAEQAREAWSSLAGLRRRSLQIALAAALVVSLVLWAALAFLMSPDIDALDRPTAAVAVALLPITALLAAKAGLIRGLGHAVQAMWPRTAFKQTVFLLGVLALVAAGISPDAVTAMSVQLAAAAAALVVTALILRRRWPVAASLAAPRTRTRRWARAAVPFLLIALAHTVIQRIGMLLVGVFLSAGEVGIYHVVMQTAALIAFPIAALNPVISPIVARLHVKGDTAAQQRLLARSAAAMAVLGAAGFLVLLLAGGWLLATVFGPEFAQGHTALIVYAFGQLVHVATGSVGVFLAMAGYEKEVLRAIVVSAVVNILLNLALIPLFGLIGAASANAISMTLTNALMAIALYRRRGLVGGPFRIGGGGTAKP